MFFSGMNEKIFSFIKNLVVTWTKLHDAVSFDVVPTDK